MISEVRCDCMHGQLLFKVIDGAIQIKCRACKEKKLIDISKLTKLKKEAQDA